MRRRLHSRNENLLTLKPHSQKRPFEAQGKRVRQPAVGGVDYVEILRTSLSDVLRMTWVFGGLRAGV